jgi:hypothetical protein
MKEDLSVSEACELTRLALELARKRGSDDPRHYLLEAARLVEEARTAWRWEAQRLQEVNSPEAIKRKLEKSIAEQVEPSLVPYIGLVNLDGGKEKGKKWLELSVPAEDAAGKPIEVRFKWLQYDSEAGFKKLLRRYAKRHHTPFAIRRGVTRPKLADAVKHLMESAKAGKLDVVTVKALHDFRAKGLANRAATGGRAKAQKAQDKRAAIGDSAVKGQSSPTR